MLEAADLIAAARPTTNVVVDGTGYTDVPDKSPFARQTSTLLSRSTKRQQ